MASLITKTKNPRKILPKQPKPKTHGGAEAAEITPEQELRRSVLACMLWEKEFYESGESVAARIAHLVPQVEPAIVAALAVEARTVHKLRHAPLWLVNAMLQSAEHRVHVAEILPKVIRRPDEMGELLAMYWGGHTRAKAMPGGTIVKKALPAQLRRGLQATFQKFDSYQLAKWDQNSAAISLLDVYRLIHPKPKDEAQAMLWKQLRDRTLPTPYTWETELSSSGDNRDKKQKWEELLKSGKLPAFALLSNLRNIATAKCDSELVFDALEKMNGRMILPFRYFSAMRHAPEYSELIERAMVSQFAKMPKIPGRTLVILDVSGSMHQTLSGKSEINRMTAACTLGAIADLICEQPIIYATAGSDSRRQHATERVSPQVHGLEMVSYIESALYRRLGGGGIFLKPVLDFLKPMHPEVERVLVITDEQDCTQDKAQSPQLAQPWGTFGNYLVNVSTDKNGIGYGKTWTHIDTLSDAVFNYILHAEMRPQTRLLSENQEDMEIDSQ